MRGPTTRRRPEPVGGWALRRSWRARRRLAPLVRRPRSRELLDRAGLIVGIIRIDLPPIIYSDGELEVTGVEVRHGFRLDG